MRTQLQLALIAASLVAAGFGPEAVKAARAAGTGAHPNTTAALAAPSSPLQPSRMTFQQVASGLSLPLFVTNAGDGSNRIFIVEQGGQIRILKNGSLTPAPFLNIAGLVSNFTGANGEQGLLCLVFDPHFSSNGIFYMTYTTTNPDPVFLYTTTLARYHISATNPDVADPASGTVLLSIPKKYTNHNGGMLAFGPDGYLYMSMGDGGSGGDPDGNGQNLDTMLGKLLRLDVDTPPPPGQKYVIPPTNPFYGSTDPGVKKEIWAYGLRNPWRFSFDRLTGDLYIGDVGQSSWEEIDFQPAGSAGGQNYGWNIMEGLHCYNDPTESCDKSGKVLPVIEYDHLDGRCAVTGGYVYRGSQYSLMTGQYIYGDVCNGQIYDLYDDPSLGWTPTLITQPPYLISSFGQDEQGELYVTDLLGGGVYHIQYAGDDVDLPLQIPSQPPYATTLDTRSATTAPDDPAASACGLPAGLASVWFSYTPAKSGPVYFDTLGSNYDTYLAVWTGTRGALTPVACNNDDAVSGTAQSALGFEGTAGTRYLIEVAQNSAAPSPVGGLLQLHVTSFQDVRGNQLFWRYIEGLFGSSITTGCGADPRLFCPGNGVTRAETAVLVLRAIHGPGYTPPNVTGIFADMPVAGKEWMEPWVDEFYNEGLTTGCGTSPLIFCPEANVTREAMAVFLLRAIHGGAYAPPVTHGIFADMPVPGLEWMEPWVDEFYNEGITTGCGMSPLVYCPANNVTRAEMAVFIDRAFGISPIP